MPSALKLERLLNESIAVGVENREALTKMGAAVSAFDKNLNTVALDVAKLKADAEERARKHSGGIRRVSTENEDQNAAIATLVTTVAAIERKTDLQTQILERGEAAGKRLWANPYAKWMALAILAYVAMALKKHGIEVPLP